MTPVDMPDDSPLLSIRGLTIRLPDGRLLLRNAQLDVAAGEFILLVGPSGSGKSTLLRWISGLADDHDGPAFSGQLRLAGSDDAADRPRVGIVFQHHALFDEMSAEANVRFAMDHAERTHGNHAVPAREWLDRLAIPRSTPTARLSGGERQRLAVARTLALEPSLLLFDEPTTGLDPVRARAVADLIQQTRQHHRRTVIVVTHDYRPFLPHRPRVVVLDAATGSLRDLPAQELPDYFEHLRVEDVPPDESDRVPPTDWASALHGLLRAPGDALWALLLVPWAVAGGWRRSAWKARYFWYYLRMTLLGGTAAFVALAGAMLGFVFTSFSFAQLPYSQVTVPLLTEELLAATGYSTYRVIVPLLISVLVAGKCGATLSADVGSRRLAYQFEALRGFGARPEFYLYGSAALAMTLAAPLLTLLAYLCNFYAALVAFLLTLDDPSVAVFHKNFLATVWPARLTLPHGTGWVLLKTTGSGLLVAVIGYVIGARRKLSATDVSRDVSLTIFWASISVLLLHSLFSFVEF